MTEEQFTKFRHEAVHVLMRLNESCESEFHISSWPHWDYDLERGTLTLSQGWRAQGGCFNSVGWHNFKDSWHVALGLGE